MNWCLSYIILCVPSGSSLLQGIQAFGTWFETWTDCKGLELSGCFKSTILDRFLQGWLNGVHAPFLFERENSGSQNAVICLFEWLGVEIYPTFSTVQLNSGCWSDLEPNFSRWYGFTTLTEVFQSCRVSQPLLSSQNQVTQNYGVLFKMQSTTPSSLSHGKCRYHTHLLYCTREPKV